MACDWRTLLSAVGFLVLSTAFIPADLRAQDTQPGRVFRDCPDCPEMIQLPPGQFLMGSSQADTEHELASVPRSSLGILKTIIPTVEGFALAEAATEHPQHTVTIPHSFALGVYPVTVRQYSVFVQETGYHSSDGCLFNGSPYTRERGSWNHVRFQQIGLDPVVCVTWQDAKAFIKWLNGKVRSSTANDSRYRLPSEAEWEYAARAGTRTARWWGDAIGEGHANCIDCQDPPEIEGHTSQVAYFDPNPFGLHDMLGNVLNYTEDCYHTSYVGAPIDGRPWLDGNCEKITVRGGGWSSNAWQVRSASRSGWQKDVTFSNVGFRVAKSP